MKKITDKPERKTRNMDSKQLHSAAGGQADDQLDLVWCYPGGCDNYTKQVCEPNS